ncbi:transferrin-binding protein-like solute binding protein [Histophilus somni]|uniref:transferrin-binding protein-like solute binding protein n=1 Tax=Histophilus somni TaxID=731 RepID=UPI00201F06DA|nr:transferrin-binding protein-like solute binding protein [Histophilus somni]
MTSFKLLGFSVLSVALLSACSSGKGSFDLDDVEHTHSSGSSRPTYQDVPSSPKEQEQVEEINQPALGYAADIPRRNAHANANLKQDKVSISDSMPINYDLSKLPSDFVEKIKQKPKFHKDSDVGKDGIDYSHDSNNPVNKRPLIYVRSGYVLGANKFDYRNKEKILYNAGFMGYVFYQGSQPSTKMPTQIVKYEGYWDFVSDAVKGRSLPEDFHTASFGAIPGQNSGATSLDEEVNRRDNGKLIGHSATFSVDFGEKKLTGQLTSNGDVLGDEQKRKNRYTVEAKIKGNRFVGSATATEKTHTIFGKDAKSRLEGGFFGPKAEELAGKFLTDDNSLFVVFGAKRETKKDDKEMPVETLFDAVKISTDNNKLEKETMDTFGNAAYLVLDGRQFPLVPESNAGTTGAGNTGKNEFITTIDGSTLNKTNHENHKKYKVTVCCSNLNYVKFGSYGEQTTANTHNGTSISQLTNGYLFLTGERTSLANMMKQKDKNVHYRGTWQAYFSSKNRGVVDTVDPGDSRNGNTANSRAEFDVDFGDKNVSGRFFAADGTQPALTMEKATITDNGFSGMAKTQIDGFQLDKGSTTGGTKVSFTDAKVDGAFYGPNAEEIGGTITSNGTGGDKVGGVFGAKRQEPSK